MPKNNKKELKEGEKFNNLTVIKLNHQDKRWRKHYLCKCDCGKEKVVQGSLLTSGNTKSCGCLPKKIKSEKRLKENRGVVNHIILQYKRHAKDRGIVFEIEYEEFKEIIDKPCYYCGEEKSN